MARRPSGPVEDNRGKRWLGTIGGRREHLAYYHEGKDRAWQVFYARTAEEQAREKEEKKRAGKIGAAELFDRYLADAEKTQAKLSHESHWRILKMFVAHIGRDLAAVDLKPLHVTEWLATRTLSSTTERNRITSIKCALSWGKRQGYLDRNPLEGITRPPARRRAAIMSDEQFRAVLAASPDDRFSDLLTALRETGARPSEIMRLEASMIDVAGEVVVMRGKTTGATGRDRVVHLTDVMLALCGRLSAEHPTGPIFRNTYGTAWTRHSVGQRFRKLRKRLGMGKEATAESMRHMFATDALENEVPIATVAELMGHTSTNMIMKNYSHLVKRADYLKAALRRVRPEDAKDT